MFSSGDGTGGDEEKLGVVDTAADCVKLVLSEMPDANGVTFGVLEGGREGECYAEIGMVESDGKSGTWQSCLFEGKYIFTYIFKMHFISKFGNITF